MRGRTRPDFSGSAVTTMQSMRKRLQKDPTLLVKAMWSETFNLPQNDERLLSLTITEAMQQLLARNALVEMRSERAERLVARRDAIDAADMNRPAKSEVRDDAEAQELADKPHLTGDAEWDAMELAATDPSRPLLKR